MEESPAVRVFASFALFIFSDPRSNLEYLYWLQLEREGKNQVFSSVGRSDLNYFGFISNLLRATALHYKFYKRFKLTLN